MWPASVVLLAASPALALPELSLARRYKDDDSAKDDSVGQYSRGLHVRTVETNGFGIATWGSVLAYFTNVTVGTPPQLMTVTFTTFASDTYFDAANASSCLPASANESYACRGGAYDPQGSSTYSVIEESPAFNLTYVDGTTAVGPLLSDVIGIGDVAISGVEFGLSVIVNSSVGNAVGALGLGYSILAGVTSGNPYPNIVDIMANTGIINSRLYSIYMGSIDGSGSILFGGIDTSKIAGPLTIVNFIPPSLGGDIQPFLIGPIVSITAASISSGNQTTALWQGGVGGVGAYADGNSLLVALAAGGTGWSVPLSVLEQVVENLPYINSSTLTCSCDNITAGDSLILVFDGRATIQFDVHEFIVPLINATTRLPIPYEDGTDSCTLLMYTEDSDEDYGYFGDAFLRNLYIVYDLDNGQAAIGQAKLEATGPPSIVEIQADPDGIAYALVDIDVVRESPNTFSIPTVPTGNLNPQVSNLVTPIGTATGTAAVPFLAQVLETTSSKGTSHPPSNTPSNTPSAAPSTIPSTTPTGPATNSSSSSSNNTAAIAGGVVGGVVGLALITVAVMCLRRRARKKSSNRRSVPEMM